MKTLLLTAQGTNTLVTIVVGCALFFGLLIIAQIIKEIVNHYKL
jgi:hypothetical protein